LAFEIRFGEPINSSFAHEIDVFPHGGHKKSLLWRRWFQSQVVGAVGKNLGDFLGGDEAWTHGSGA